ncbi:MAG: DUF4870 family protein [Steroidobacteraceae bacterium]
MTEPLAIEAMPAPGVSQSLITYTNIIYALHALTVAIAVLGSASDGGQFIEGAPSILAVIMNYVRRPAVRGTLLESHFRWQIRTFWFALLFAIVIGGASFLLLWAGIAALTIGLLALGIWIVYRVARGWFSLRDRRPMLV